MGDIMGAIQGIAQNLPNLSVIPLAWENALNETAGKGAFCTPVDSPIKPEQSGQIEFKLANGKDVLVKRDETGNYGITFLPPRGLYCTEDPVLFYPKGSDPFPFKTDAVLERDEEKSRLQKFSGDPVLVEPSESSPGKTVVYSFLKLDSDQKSILGGTRMEVTYWLNPIESASSKRTVYDPVQIKETVMDEDEIKRAQSHLNIIREAGMLMANKK